MTKFSFGKNWEDFIKFNFSEERVDIAKDYILEFLELTDLEGKYFLDIGCGSGLHSLSAFKAGARKIVSFDVDPDSVKTTEKIRKICGNPSNWEILSGSVLDTKFISGLEPADIVYSWGVLHHTGNMWKAIENASELIKENGLFYIAIYVTTSKSDYWLKIKKEYNNASSFRKKIMGYDYILKHLIISKLIHFQNPIAYVRNYKKNRGMSYFTDVKDWLGGYPYEDAKIEEIFKFCRNKLNLELINIKTGEANIEYLLEKKTQ